MQELAAKIVTKNYDKLLKIRQTDRITFDLKPKPFYSGMSGKDRKEALRCRVAPSEKRTWKVEKSLLADKMVPIPKMAWLTVCPTWNGLLYSARSPAKPSAPVRAATAAPRIQARAFLPLPRVFVLF